MDMQRMVLTGAEEKVVTEPREAVSLAPCLQPGDAKAISIVVVLTVYQGGETVENGCNKTLTFTNHRAEATVLMRSCRLDQ